MMSDETTVEEPREEAGEASAEGTVETAVEGSGDETAPDPAEEAEVLESALIGEAEGVPDEGSVADTTGFLKGLIEALIFVSDKPLELKEIARGARVDRARAGELLDEIRADYSDR